MALIAIQDTPRAYYTFFASWFSAVPQSVRKSCVQKFLAIHNVVQNKMIKIKDTNQLPNVKNNCNISEMNIIYNALYVIFLRNLQIAPRKVFR